MNRRTFLRAVGSAALLPMLPRGAWASANFRRRRPSDANWPSAAAWKQLNDAVGGNLIPVDFPLSILKTDPDSAAAKQLIKYIRNPYYIGDQPGLTQTLGSIALFRRCRQENATFTTGMSKRWLGTWSNARSATSSAW